ncbi:MAG: nucleotidyltransferase family protein [Tissierellaceae bacterium]
MITGIIMAAGFSSRMGEDKLLMEVDGFKMVERVIYSCKNSLLDNIILIYRRKEVKEICEKYNINTIYNPNAYLGQSESMKLGVEASTNSEAYMFITGDQPFITSNLINLLINEYKNGQEQILVPYYDGKNGTPTIFSSRFKEDLLQVKGDKGGREIIKDNSNYVKKIYIKNRKLGLDIDRKEDLLNLFQ